MESGEMGTSRSRGYRRSSNSHEALDVNFERSDQRFATSSARNWGIHVMGRSRAIVAKDGTAAIIKIHFVKGSQ